MKHVVSCLVVWIMLVATVAVAQGQAPAWESAIGIGTIVRATVADATGNIYLTGSFSSSVTFGNTTLVGGGSKDGFVAKYNTQSGIFVWAQRFGGNNDDAGEDIVFDNGNIYVGGSFADIATFGAFTLTSNGRSDDAVVLKLVDQGASSTVVWAQAVGGNSTDYGYAVAVNGPNVYLGGQFVVNSNDGFVAKLTDLGSSAVVSWLQILGGLNYDVIHTLAVEGPNVYAGGVFTGTVTFGATTITSSGPSASGYFTSGGMVVKLTDNGTSSSIGWVQHMPANSGQTTVYSLAVRGAVVYVTGYFSNTTAFGGFSLTSAGSIDMYVAKIADAGAAASYVWVQRSSGSGFESGWKVLVVANSVYVAGFADTATFGSQTITNAGGINAFVAQLADAGSSARFAWVQQAGGSGEDEATGLCVSGQRLYVVGQCLPPADFGAISVSAPIGVRTGFLAALTPTALATSSVASLMTIAIAPNPAHNRATIQLLTVPGTPTAALTILDALGRTLRTQTAAANSKAELDLTGLVPGIYAVRVAAGGSTATQRLVVE